MNTRRSIIKKLMAGVVGTVSSGSILGVETMLELSEENLKYDEYFFTVRTIVMKDKKQNEEFVENYLDDGKYRMRSLFSYLKSTFWQKHSDEIVKLYKSKDLVFRAKVANVGNNCVEVINIWSSKKIHDDCYNKCNGDMMFSEFDQRGFKTELKSGVLKKSDVLTFANKVTSNGKHVVEIGAGPNRHIKVNII